LVLSVLIVLLRAEQNEGAELKDYEMDKLRQKCLNFVNDSDPSAHLSMGEFTYTKMKACFDILKSMANAAGEAAASGGPASGAPIGVKLISAGSGGNNQELEQRVHELEQLVQQRDNEIAIMVNMIRKEHGSAIPAELLSRGVVDYSSNQNEHHEAKPQKQSAPAKPPGDYASTLVVDPAVLEDPAKAFEAFKAQYPKNDAIRDNKVALKRKYDAAKALASEVNDARNQIKALTSKIDKLRKQQAIADEGLLDAGGEEGHTRPSSAEASAARAAFEEAETKLKAQIDTHKVAYKKGFNELSELKKEIQHIQKMLEMGRIKLQKDFDLWYQRQGKGALLTETLLAQAKPEASKNQASGLARPSKSASPERPESGGRKAPAWDAEAKASKRVSSSQSQRASAARQSTAR
jgi:kinesin family protein 6/9